MRIKKILAPRGTIFDRNGKILGNTRPSFNLYIVPEDIKDFTETIDGLVKLLDLDREEIIAKTEGREGLSLILPRQDRDGHVYGPGGKDRSEQVLPSRSIHTD